MFATNRTTGDYHGDMDSNQFESWLTNLLSLLEEPSVLVMDNASYHNRSRIKYPRPNASWKKQDIKNYLTKAGIEVEENLLKSELLAIAIQDVPGKVYVVDELIAAHGHKVLRLPPYHCQYNAIEMVWSQAKRYFDVHIGEHGYGHEKVLSMWDEALKQVSAENWKSYISHVEQLIEDAWNQEIMFDSMDDQSFIINVGGDSDESSNDD